MSDWDEIKRLAADFQKIQLSSTLQKLSEPNCIEVVNLLVEQNLIHVIYTIDGKEYITPEHFRREVEDELYAHGGRANAVAIAKALHVDLSRVHNVAEQMAAESTAVHFVLGQLLTDAYLERIAAEINDTLAQKGQVSVFELASGHYDLPTDFLLEHVLQRYLGTIIRARQDAEDGSRFFTAKYIARCRARLRGAMLGLTLPTPVAQFFAPIGAQDAMYHQLIADGLDAPGVVTSRQKGALFVPSVYTRTQTGWVDAFWRQNGYVEYEAVARLGVTAPLTFVRRQLGTGEGVVYLGRCCVAQRLIGQVEAALEECIATGSYLDATTVLPSAIGEEDVVAILALCLTASGSGAQKATQVFGATVLTTKFIDDLVDPCTELATAKGKQAVELGHYQQHLIDAQLSASGARYTATSGHDDHTHLEAKGDRKDDRRRKATGGKGGGGTQGRETKTKSTKKHYRGGGRGAAGQSDSDDDEPTVGNASAAAAGKGRKGGAVPTAASSSAARFELITAADIEQVIGRKLDAEGLDYLARPLAEHFVPQFTRLALTAAQVLYEATVQQSSGGGTGAVTQADRRQAHAALQERLNNALVDIRLYERGVRLLPIGQHAQLVKYLLRTLATDVANELHAYVAAESKGVAPDAATVWTPEVRAKIVQECDAEYKAALTALNKTLAGTSVEEFLGAAEVALQACSMILKKPDKKKDRQLVLCHKHGLLDKLAQCTDPALVLHLATLVVFTVSQQSILHASGKHVSSLLSFLQPVLGAEQGAVLRQFHDLVLRLLRAAGNESADLTETLQLIDGLLPKVKEIAAAYKKVGVPSE